MGRQGPRLVPFLQDGMNNKKYRNLIPEDPSGLTFSIVLPHKTKKLDMEDELIFKDWYALNGKKYVFHSKHYTDAKQAITASLRKSDYVEKIHISDDRLTYRILNKAEVKDKKRLKKELKKLKEVKVEASESDDALSSVESGYGSGTDSPGIDHSQVSLEENLITLNGDESSPLLNTMNANILFGINDALQNTCSDKFDFLKTEPMDASILSKNSLAIPGAPILFGENLYTNNIKMDDYFPENMNSAQSLNSMEISEAPDSYSSGFEGSLSLENESDFDLSGLVNYVLKDTDFPLMHEDYNNNQASETWKVHELETEPEDLLTEKLFANLTEDILAADSHPPMPSYEENFPEPISSFPGGGFDDHKMEPDEKIYLCKKCVHLGKIPVLFFEPQFEKTTETSGALNIVFDAAVLKEINSCKSIKEYKFIDDHLMVILEPNDE